MGEIDIKRKVFMEHAVFKTFQRADAASKGRGEPLYKVTNVALRLPLHIVASGVGHVVSAAFKVKTFLEFYNEYPHGKSEEYHRYHRIREQEAATQLDELFNTMFEKRENSDV